ncbi:uncharacterized protein METZ01_LOCUS193390 [marine metagenome]|uniref:Uncharacterized protein n=1 Tax=marine metagenome TaxID=408172 RepID=A0A382DPY1_9ZZZZ
MAEQEVQRNFKTVDIIDYSMQSNPTSVNDAFDQIITSKVVDGLETRKREVSARMFSDKEEIPVEEPEVEIQAEPEPETTETQ